MRFEPARDRICELVPVARFATQPKIQVGVKMSFNVLIEKELDTV